MGTRLHPIGFGDDCLEFLTAFLAFVRTAHYRTAQLAVELASMRGFRSISAELSASMRHRPCVIALSNAAAAPMGADAVSIQELRPEEGQLKLRDRQFLWSRAEVRGMCSSWLTWTGSTAIRRTSELIITAATFCQRDIVLLHRACKPPHVYRFSGQE